MINESESKQAIINIRTRTTKLERERDYWSEEEREQLRELFYNGTGISEIAIILQRSELTVVEQVKLLGLYSNSSSKKKSGKKHLHCLSPNCQNDPCFCPHCKAYPAEKEDD